MRKKMTAVLTATILILILTGCSSNKESIDTATFLDTMEDLGYMQKGTGQSDSKADNVRVNNEDNQYNITCSVFKEKEAAVELFDESLTAAKYFAEDDSYDLSVKESGSGNYQKFSMNGKTVDINKYTVFVRIDNVIIVAAAKDNGEADITEINGVIKELGY